jgi:hypothetical protein
MKDKNKCAYCSNGRFKKQLGNDGYIHINGVGTCGRTRKKIMIGQKACGSFNE